MSKITEIKPKPLNVSELQVLALSAQNIAEFCNVPETKKYLQAFVDGATAVTEREKRKQQESEPIQKGPTND